MNIRIPLSYLSDLFGQLQLISLVFCEMCFICISFYLKKGEGHGRLWNTFEVFFNPLIFYIFPIFFIYSLWISFPFKYIKSIVKSWQKGGMLESNCFFSTQ